MSQLRKPLLDFCSGSGDPTNALRKLLRKSCGSRSLQLPTPVSVLDTDSLNTLIDVFQEVGFRDFPVIRRFMRDLHHEVVSLESALKLLENSSAFGCMDECVTGRLLVATLKRYPLCEISLNDCLRMLRILKVQRFRHIDLIESISRRVLSEGVASQKFTLVRMLGELDLLGATMLIGLPRPATHSDRINLAWGLILQEARISAEIDVPALIYDCIEPFGKRDSINSLGLSESAKHKLRLVRDAIYFLHRESIYENLSDSTKFFFSNLMSESESKPLSGSPRRVVKPALQKVSDTLFAENVAHSVHGIIGPFVVDIVERDRKIVWEYDDSDRYYSDGTEAVKSSYYELKRRVLNAMGYKVISVPHWHWKKMNNKKLRGDYCRTSRYLALTDIRETLGMRRDPRNFRVSENLFLNSSEHIFQSENIYKKQRPKQTWAWNKPTGTLRIAI